MGSSARSRRRAVMCLRFAQGDTGFTARSRRSAREALSVPRGPVVLRALSCQG
jgi:hypothetical protein